MFPFYFMIVLTGHVLHFRMINWMAKYAVMAAVQAKHFKALGHSIWISYLPPPPPECDLWIDFSSGSSNWNAHTLCGVHRGCMNIKCRSMWGSHSPCRTFSQNLRGSTDFQWNDPNHAHFNVLLSLIKAWITHSFHSPFEIYNLFHLHNYFIS